MKTKKLNKLIAVIIIITINASLILALIIGSCLAAFNNINWPTEILIGVVSTLIAPSIIICQKILEKHNETIVENINGTKEIVK